MNRFESTWLSHIRARKDGVGNVRVLVACSGGGDSTALLAFLWAARRSLGIELVVAHADHKLRETSGEDAAFVRELCRKLDLDLVEADLDVSGHAQRTGHGLETAARELRWAWLKAAAESSGAAVVATGHNLDDHTETVCLRLSRGGGSGALTPLPARQALRWSPLVQVRRAELRAYLRALGLPWREDETNASDFTARNRWRKLLRALREEAPGLDRHLWETHVQVEELRAFRDGLIASWRGPRWEAVQGQVMLRGAWTEPELRWVLDAAFRALEWPREAHQLHGIAAWATPHLNGKSRKSKSWGKWRLVREPSGWALHPMWQESLLSQGRLDEGETPREET
ncbi:MAG TPA: tRNA lysidine(34) synthetase TilS [Holophaga sp.]|nr:tRNA lysidine(34) synthetase TilS [Holophaga sp.]HPS66996.1 tRNA lysidine(34) synthetase TilS [Holophaga sp.]